MRYTPKDLSNDIDELNSRLANEGALARFETGGRNGYQAVDEYAVDAQGVRQGSGCCSNVGCGTSRECYGYSMDRYYQIVNNILRDKVAELSA